MSAGRALRGLPASYTVRGAVGFGVGAAVSLVWIAVASLVPSYQPLWTALVILGLAAGGAVGGAILFGGRTRSAVLRGALAFGVGLLVTWILLTVVSYALGAVWGRFPATTATVFARFPTKYLFPVVIALAYWAGGLVAGRIARRGTSLRCGFLFFVGVLDSILLLGNTGSLGILNSGAFWNSPVAFICAYVFGGAFYGVVLDLLGGKEAAVSTADASMAAETWAETPVPSTVVPRKPMSHALRGAIGFGVIGVLAMTAVPRAVSLLTSAFPPLLPTLLREILFFAGSLLGGAALGASGGAALAWGTPNRRAFWTTVLGFGVSFVLLGAQVPLYMHLQDLFPPDSSPPMILVAVSNTLPLIVAAAIGSLFLRATKRLTVVGSLILAVAALFGFAIGAAIEYGVESQSLMEGLLNHRLYFVLEILNFVNTFASYIIGGAVLGFALDRLERKDAGVPEVAEIPD